MMSYIFMVHFDNIANWLRKTEGRDKLCKILQYVCRLIAAHYQGKNDYYHLMYDGLFKALREARKLFRIFKSVDEYQSIVHLVFYGEQQLSTFLHILTKTLYFFYWIFDNISVAARVKLFNLNHQKYHKIGLKIRFTALILSLAIFLYQVQFKKVTREQKFNINLKAAKNLFDLLPAGKDSGILSPTMGEHITAMGGLISALISTYQTYVQK